MAMAAMMTACTTDIGDNPTPQGKTVHIKVKADTGGSATTRSHFYPTTGVVELVDGDVIHIASNGRYIGKLTNKGGVFEGDIVEPSTGNYLYAYFLGNKDPGDLSPGDTECLIKISDQTSELPFLAYGSSMTKYTTPDQTYICILNHQCGVVAAQFLQGIEGEVILDNVRTNALIDFSDPDNSIISRKAKGTIKMHALDKNIKLAMMLPTDSAEKVTMTAGGKQYDIDLPQIVASKVYRIFEEGSPIRIDFTATDGTSSNDGERYAKLVDKTTATKWNVSTSSKKNGVWFVEFNSMQPFTPTAYALITGNDNEKNKNRNPKSWKLMAKAQMADEWTVASTIVDDQTMEDKNLTPYTFPLDVEGQKWQYFRFEVSDHHGANSMQLSELQFYATDIEEAEEAIVYYGDNSNSSYAMPIRYLIDDDSGTTFGGSWNSYPDGVIYGEFHTNRPINPIGYVLRSTNSPNPYHPHKWKLMAKASEFDDDWTTIAEETDNYAISARSTSYYFPLAVTGNRWQYFRLEVIMTPADAEHYWMELTEFKFYIEGETTPTPAVNPGPPQEPERVLTDESLVATNGSPGIGKKYGYDKCVDEDLKTWWETKENQKTNDVWFVEFYRMTPFAPVGYSIASVDYTPKKWKLYAKKKETDNWTLISTQNITWIWNNATVWRDFTLDVQGYTWQYFRFEVSEQEGKGEMSLNDRILIKEIKLY